ncbi:MAG: TraR/DksA family transcriptional regulator [Phycisphaerales bacterium]|nr:TraR/DksA family transcriptional regulator [Phycisphaerales bacterium]
MAKKTTRKASSKKKGTAKKTTRKKATAKKAASTKTAKKPVAKKKATAKKTTTKKATTKKAVKKKSGVSQKATAKKSSTKKAAAKSPSTPPRKRGRRTVLEAAMSNDADGDGYVVVNGRRVRRIAVTAPPASSRRKSAPKKAAKAASRPKKKAKSRLTPDDLNTFRELLLNKRREVMSAIDGMETEALRTNSGESSGMPIHMADIGSDAYEQDLQLGISASERERIIEIDAALGRIAEGTYGICELSGKAIRKARLRAKPWARMTIDTAREEERTGRRR